MVQASPKGASFHSSPDFTNTAHHAHTTTSPRPIPHRTHTLRTHQHQTPSKLPTLHATSGCDATQTYALSIILSTHKREHTTRARTYPAVTITTPELSPDTATGVRWPVVVASPTCGNHTASQPQHKPVHPTPLHPPSAPPRNALAPALCCCPPSTISLQKIPQSHTHDSVNARVTSNGSNVFKGCLISQLIHKYFTPCSHHNIAPTHHTPHAHPTHSASNPIRTTPTSRNLWQRCNTNIRAQHHPKHAQA